VNAAQIKEDARRLFAQELGIAPEEIRDDTVLKRLPHMGMGKVFQVLGRLERQYGIAISDDRLYGLSTLADLEQAVRAIGEKRADGADAEGGEGTGKVAAARQPDAPATVPSAPRVRDSAELDGWLRSLDELVPTPEEYTRYTVDRDTALEVLRTGKETLELLTERGLRCADGPDGPLYDEHDLYNVAMYSGTGRSVPEVAVRYNIRLARADVESWTRPEVWRIRHFAACPENGRCEEPWELAAVRPERFGGELLETAHDLHRDGPVPSGTVAGRPSFMVRDCLVRTAGKHMRLRSQVLRDAYRETLEEFRSGRIRFQSLPEALRTDSERARANGTGNCVSSSLHLAKVIAEAGFPVRTRKGYFVAVGAEDHGWMEVLEDGEWKALDPALALLAEWDLGVERCAAFTEFCAGSYLNRFVPCDCAADEEVVRHRHGDREFDEVPTTIVTRAAAAAGEKGRR
jgi:acyl carrier protein